MTQPLAEKVGVLQKQGHFRKNWKKRTFLLLGNGVLQYKSASSGTIKGDIQLGLYSIKVASALDIDTKNTPTAFVIHLIPQNLHVHDFFLCAKDQKDLDEWIEALSFACTETKKRDRMEGKKYNSAPKKNPVVGTAVHSFTQTKRRSIRAIRRSTTIGSSRLSIRPASPIQEPLVDKRKIIIIVPDGPLCSPLISHFIEAGWCVKLFCFSVFNKKIPVVQQLPPKWVNPDILAGVDCIFDLSEAESAFIGCHTLFLPYSIDNSTNGFPDVVRYVSINNVKQVIKVSFGATAGYTYEVASVDCLEQSFMELGVPLRLILPVLPFECIFRFAKRIIPNFTVTLPFEKDTSTSFVSLNDIVRAVCKINQDFLETPHRVYLANATPVSPLDIVSCVNKARSIQITFRYTPQPPIFGDEENRWAIRFTNLLCHIGKHPKEAEQEAKFHFVCEDAVLNCVPPHPILHTTV